MKKGISLIVLVITIIVMIILAASVVISLNNTGIINKASQAVDLTDERQVQDIAALVWAECYLDSEKRINLESSVKTELENQGITEDKWNITVTETGVTITNKKSQQPGTLGYLIKDATYYGKTVDYEANGVTNWKVFYHTNDYVYLIASEAIEYSKIPTAFSSISGTNVGTETGTLLDGSSCEFATVNWDDGPSSVNIQNSSLWMAEWPDYSENSSTKIVASFLDETIWNGFVNNTTGYSSYVVGAIGTPTAEMFVASWNAKREATNNNSTYNKKLRLTMREDIGYYVDNITTSNNSTSSQGQGISAEDKLYVINNDIWLSSPACEHFWLLRVGSTGYIGDGDAITPYGIRPVVCLKASTPAKVGTTTDFSLVK